ncbi:14168_t:CDS:2 [Gigaspora margarita]|uniref:14168_t:CDS:1 n=1 Tax=Gigaspora margarita TaxID=4874 RepID=A0ABM8VY62_GIGMA|nr:14168_t:CDS:2 [Gigaspora margarita]
MSHLIGEKIAKFKHLYKEYEPLVDDLQSVLIDFLPELKQTLNLGFVQVERIRQYINDRALMSDLRWRAENHVDSISLQDVPRDFTERGLFFFHKADKFNRPCAILNLREYVREDGSPSFNEVKKYIIFNAEVARRLLLDKSKESRDGPVLQYVIILDLKGAGVSTLSLDLLRFTTDIFRHHFPGSVGAKHGGSDTYEYDLETYKPYQYYGIPPPILSRITSYDSLNDEFFSAPTTPYHSRPPTPKPSSPGLDHVPAWLRMSQLNMSPPPFQNDTRSMIIAPSPIRPTTPRHISSSFLRLTPINQDVSQLTSHNNDNKQQIHSLTPITINSDPNYNVTRLRNDSDSTYKDVSYAQQKTQKKTRLSRFLSLSTELKFYLQKLLRRLVARKVSGVLYYLVIVAILRGGLVDEFWRFLTQQVTMQLGWSSSTTTSLTTAALSAALSGRTNSRQLFYLPH